MCVTVPAGGTGIAEIVLPVLNTVMPQLEPQRDEIWFLRPDPPPPPGAVAPAWPPLADEPLRVPALAPAPAFPVEVREPEARRRPLRSASACRARTRRLHGLGQTRYIADLALPGMLHAKIKRAGIASARIVRIDTSAAEAMPGVMAVLTGREIPVNSFGPSLQDQKEGVKVTESGLQYKVLREGGGVTPGPEDFVKVHYRGTFIDGSEFDSSYSKGEPARVQTDGVIKGWTEALQMMKTGSKWQLIVPPELAYGRGGLGQRIPPNKVLVFDMELLAVEKGEKADKQPTAEAKQARTARKMSTTGEIGKTEHGYIVRTRKGNVPTEILTVLNPDPKILSSR